jgi:hypothetical protein
VTFYIDGTLVATITTHLPASGITLSWFFGAAAHSSTTGSGILFNQMVIFSDF